MLRALLSVLAGTVLAIVVAPALPAQAGIWHEYPSLISTRTCSESRVHNGQTYEAGINRIVTSLSRGRPVMVLVIPGKLPWWNASTPALRHYVTIHGYGGVVHGDGSVHPTTFKVADPADASEHSIDVGELLLENANLAWNGIDTVAIVRT